MVAHNPLQPDTSTSASHSSTRGRRRSPPVVGEAAEEKRSIDLLKLLGFVIALFAALLVAAFVSLPDLGNQIDVGQWQMPNINQGDARHALLRNRNEDESIGRFGHVTADSAPVVPEAKWPTSVRDVEEFEDIIHPGDGRTRMPVPKFWSAPIHNNTLMSRDLAMKIGSCVTADTRGSHVKGSSCPWNKRTIFVALASYRDWQCRDTLDSIFERAKHPERIRVAVIDQREEEELSCNSPVQPCNRDGSQALCKYKNQVDVYTMIPRLAIGPPFARHVAYRYYRGEYYAMQIDAQTTFVKDWDVAIIEQHEETHDEMAVLSHYPLDIEGSISERNGNSLRTERNIMCHSHYVGNKKYQYYLENDVHTIGVSTKPLLNPFWAAAFSFARGHFVVNVPYDQYQPMIFNAEEVSVAIRGFTVGYDFFAPAKNICFHTYARGPNEEAREKVPLFWENEKIYENYDEDMTSNSLKRILGILGMNPDLNVHQWNHVGKEVYGVGGARTSNKFFDVLGIDVKEKTHEPNLCDFVENGSMHKQFMKHLRSDGMGVDYEKILFRYKDPKSS